MSNEQFNNCKHGNAINLCPDYNTRILWCSDCGAIKYGNEEWLKTQMGVHIFDCPICNNAPTVELNPFMIDGKQCQCRHCDFVPENKAGQKTKYVSIIEWNEYVWGVITKELEDLRNGYKAWLETRFDI